MVTKLRYDRELENECPNCGNKFKLQFNCKLEDVAYCPFCGEDLFFTDLEETEVEDYEDSEEDEDGEEDIDW